MQKLLQTLNHYTILSEPSTQLITNCFVHKKISKGTILIREGQTARYFYWLVKGTMRGRIAPKGELITTWFATKNMFCSSMPSFISRKPSRESIEALEDCEVYCISRHDVLKLFKQTTEMSSIVRQMAEEAYIYSLNRTYQFQSLSAKERYESFVAHYPAQRPPSICKILDRLNNQRFKNQNKRAMLKKGCLIALGVLLIVIIASYGLIQRRLTQLAPSPTIAETPTSIIGFNHIGLVVKDLDKMLDFYQNATNFELISREKISDNEAANKLYSNDSISYEIATLKSPNFLLELTKFDNQTDTVLEKMPPYGPGMTHTCFQTATANSGYDKFVKAGVEMLSRGDEPIDLGGCGVTYAYAHDPEGNMMELEQMSDFIIWLKIDKDFSQKHKMWMTQVAIMTPDVKKLAAFYQEVYEIEPYRFSEYPASEVTAKVIDLDGVSMKGAWFMLDGKEKKMELFQYGGTYPTLNTIYKRSPTELGYTFSLEVLDIKKEYQRLKEKGLEFLSEPQQIGKFWMVYANDIDGNVFSLRQAIDPNFSAPNI